jgi:uncharacterized protein YndB with AHSA1/START domain
MNTLTDTTVEISREINAPRNRVYAAWADTKLAKQWWGPKGVGTRALVIEPRPGGKFQWDLTSEEGEEITAEGEFLEAVPPEKLVFTWKGTQDETEGEAGDSLVSLTFVEVDAHTTELHLTHEGLPSEQSRDNHTEGWNSALDKLERLFAK